MSESTKKIPYERPAIVYTVPLEGRAVICGKAEDPCTAPVQS